MYSVHCESGVAVENEVTQPQFCCKTESDSSESGRTAGQGPLSVCTVHCTVELSVLSVHCALYCTLWNCLY